MPVRSNSWAVCPFCTFAVVNAPDRTDRHVGIATYLTLQQLEVGAVTMYHQTVLEAVGEEHAPLLVLLDNFYLDPFLFQHTG